MPGSGNAARTHFQLAVDDLKHARIVRGDPIELDIFISEDPYYFWMGFPIGEIRNQTPLYVWPFIFPGTVSWLE